MWRYDIYSVCVCYVYWCWDYRAFIFLIALLASYLRELALEGSVFTHMIAHWDSSVDNRLRHKVWRVKSGESHGELLSIKFSVNVIFMSIELPCVLPRWLVKLCALKFSFVVPVAWGFYWKDLNKFTFFFLLSCVCFFYVFFFFFFCLLFSRLLQFNAFERKEKEEDLKKNVKHKNNPIVKNS